MTARNVIVVGLGAMGLGMAQSLLRAGHHVTGLDHDPARLAAFAADGGTVAGNAAQTHAALAEAEAVILVVVNAQQTEAVLFGPEGISGQLRKGAVILSCATFAPHYAVDFERRAEACGLHYLDAPISGGAAKAAQGKLSIMASGRAEAFTTARPFLDAMAETVFELGDRAGAGSAMKIVNQLLAGIHVVSTAEALTFGMGQGIDPKLMVDVLSRCAGSSWMFQNRGPFIADGDYRPHSAVEIFVKDLGIVTQAAEDAGLSVPLAKTALNRFLEAREAGFGREGDVAVAKLYAEEGHCAIPGWPRRTGE